MSRQFDPVNCQYGAPMGRREFSSGLPVKVRLFRVRMVDGDYDDGGAYWGGSPSQPLYCARDDAGTFRRFVRAQCRTSAKALIARDHQEVRFYH